MTETTENDWIIYSPVFTDNGDPVIECPSKIVENQYPTLFHKPKATDNSGKAPELTITSQTVFEMISPSFFVAVTWTARDDSGNKDRCTINYSYKNEGKTKAYRFVFSVLIPLLTIMV